MANTPRTGDSKTAADQTSHKPADPSIEDLAERVKDDDAAKVRGGIKPRK
jgi:hypothetical protein